ncbi:hypothetical protein OH76DRAFT_1354879 [Lentinus brumalis]|uniref:L domain-like protein n=1 Tax=Lentinus brumalis TaxID=2498619 RepID=A0A371D3V0_9APHY|nr:hypothetical protein OH76DRAFT_1354879 [Polyporus brumalis]
MLTRRAHKLPDVTPTRFARAIDPFSASAKDAWRPPTYEKKAGHAAPGCDASSSHTYASRPVYSPTPKQRAPAADLDVPDFTLTDDEYEKLKSPRRFATQGEMDQEKWDRVVSNAIDKQNGVIDLGRTATSVTDPPVTCIPPKAIADLQKLVIIPITNAPSSAPSSPTLSPTPIPTTSFSPSRAFNRATTMPAAGFTQSFFASKDGEVLRGTPAARAASIQTVPQQTNVQFSRNEIELYLANNSITRLPAELFRVSALAVLSLRSNGLTHLPPQIAQLTALRELNVAQNKLRWLPAEMLGMRLGKLAVAGNPWMPPPPAAPRGTNENQADTTPTVSDPIVHFPVPPLTESCLRTLLAPYNPSPPPAHSQPTPPHASSSTVPAPPPPCSPYPLPPTHTHLKTFLEARHSVPITADYTISPNISAVLRVCAPAAVSQPAEDRLPKHKKARWEDDDTPGPSRSACSASDDDEEEDIFAPRPRPRAQEEDEITGVSVCPSLRHRAADGSWLDGRVPVFVRHAEERWTWQAEIAGVRVGAEGVGGVGVPVRWRGCSRGCLSFLDPPAPVPEPPEEPQPRPRGEETGAADGGVDLDLDLGLGGDGDVEMEDLTLERGLADPEDFEEGF